MAYVLVVDDDPDYVEIVRTVLESHGYHVEAAANGSEALEKMRRRKPALVLLDVMMSYVLDGLNVSQEMREDPALKDVPIIMVSSIAGSPYAGMFPTDQYIPIDQWLSKPVNPQELLRHVARFVS